MTPAGQLRADLLAAADAIRAGGPRGVDRVTRADLEERLRGHADRVREERACLLEGTLEFAALHLAGASREALADPRVSRALVALQRHVRGDQVGDPAATVLLDFVNLLAGQTDAAGLPGGLARHLVEGALRRMELEHALGLDAEIAARADAGAWPPPTWAAVATTE